MNWWPRANEWPVSSLTDPPSTGAAALQLFQHALAPVAQLPVLEVLSGVHIVTDLTLGLGTVVFDYLA